MTAMTNVPAPDTVSTIDRLLDWWADRYPERAAHVVPGVGELTYARWRSRTGSAAAGLLARGVRPGTRVALAFQRRTIADFAVCLTAVHRLGAVAVLLPADGGDEDLGRLIAVSRSDALVVPRTETAPQSGLDVPVLALEDLEQSERRTVRSAASPDDVATAVFTSGTTGEPKAVAMRHRDITHELDVRMPAFTNGGPVGTLLHAFPLSVPVGQWAAQAPLLRGLRAVAMPEFNPSSFLDLVDEYEVTETAMVPAMAAAIRDLATKRRPRAAALRRVTIGSARCPLPVLRTVRDLFSGAAVVVDYSSTESGWAGTAVEYHDGFQPGTVGQPHPGCAVRIVDDEGVPVPAGHVGNVELRLPPHIPPRFYLDDPVATASTFRGRWVRMADLGWVGVDGCLHLTARTKDVVNIGGRKVSCPEVEHVFEDFPSVREAAAFALDDSILGEELGVAVIADGDVDVEDLRRYAAVRLSAYKMPSRIVLADRFPRTRSGKVRKDRLAGLIVRSVPVAQDRNVETALIGAVHEVLDSDDVRAEQSLIELGASSVDVIRIYHRVTEAMGVEFDVALMFDPAPLTELARRIGSATGAAS